MEAAFFSCLVKSHWIFSFSTVERWSFLESSLFVFFSIMFEYIISFKYSNSFLVFLGTFQRINCTHVPLLQYLTNVAKFCSSTRIASDSARQKVRNTLFPVCKNGITFVVFISHHGLHATEANNQDDPQNPLA